MALTDAKETAQTEENKSDFSVLELLVKFQPSRIVHAREEDWEPNWRTVTTPKPGFGPILLDAVVLDCLVTMLSSESPCAAKRAGKECLRKCTCFILPEWHPAVTSFLVQ